MRFLPCLISRVYQGYLYIWTARGAGDCSTPAQFQYVSISFPMFRFAGILSPDHWPFVPPQLAGLFWR